METEESIDKETKKTTMKARCIQCGTHFDYEECICKTECPNCHRIGSSVDITQGLILY